MVDPRNKKALLYILDRIKDAGYFAKFHVINSHDYGVAQNRVRIYLIGFLDKTHFNKFQLPKPIDKKIKLSDILGIQLEDETTKTPAQKDLFGNHKESRQMSLSSKNGFNDYFLFNDLRNGHTTIHSWDILETTQRQKEICLLLLKNRRKSQFGPLDGNPLSIEQFKLLDSTISQKELEKLVDLEIIKKFDYRYEILDFKESDLDGNEWELLNLTPNNFLVIDELKLERSLKIKKISITDTINSLLEKKIIKCVEQRFDFKNTKISSGLHGVNRVFMPSSDVFPTLVASDTNDYVSTIDIRPTNHEQYRSDFLNKVYFTEKYRKITKDEACLIQGFPKDFLLPKSRARWMKLIGNSVSVPVIDVLIKQIIETGVFNSESKPNQIIKSKVKLEKERVF